VIRPATAGDAAAIAGLELLLFGPEAWSEQQVAEELSGLGRRGWVFDGPQHVLSSPENPSADMTPLQGYAITRTIDEVSDLERIAVDAAYQRGRRASALLIEAMRAAAAAGAERMLLEVADDNEAALRFYTQHGFAEIDRRPRYYRSGAAAIVMAADLAPGEDSGSAVSGR
jgi:ribosomal protein S18 acetylase RimI-like enzyme